MNATDVPIPVNSSSNFNCSLLNYTVENFCKEKGFFNNCRDEYRLYIFEGLAWGFFIGLILGLYFLCAALESCLEQEQNRSRGDNIAEMYLRERARRRNQINRNNSRIPGEIHTNPSTSRQSDSNRNVPPPAYHLVANPSTEV
jgi:hypothetical protein